jgi:hypothetical protein
MAAVEHGTKQLSTASATPPPTRRGAYLSQFAHARVADPQHGPLPILLTILLTIRAGEDTANTLGGLSGAF